MTCGRPGSVPNPRLYRSRRDSGSGACIAKRWQDEGRARLEALKRSRRLTATCSANLGFADAVEFDTKVRLAVAINRQLESRRLTQAAAAAALSTNQPKVSALKHYKLDGFSVERLMTFLTALGSDTEIRIRAPKRA